MNSRRAIPDQPAGWYPDPEGSGALVYFDGHAWTDAKVTSLAPSSAPIHRRPPAPTAPIAPATTTQVPRRPAKALRPFYLYAGAAAGLLRLGSRVSRAQYCVFLATNAAALAAIVWFGPSIGWITFTVFLLTALIVSIPRLHDIGNAGTQLIWLPALALPLIGWLQGLRLLKKLFSAGHLGANRYGPPPL